LENPTILLLVAGVPTCACGFTLANNTTCLSNIRYLSILVNL
jgi:hypothetical protein